MSGTLRGSIEHKTTASQGYITRDCFAATVRFFDSHPAMTRIASYKGNGTGGGAYQATGTIDANTIRGYSGDASYSGEGAYGVWRWNRTDGAVMYICVQWGSNSNGFQPGKGTPGVVSYTYGLGIQIALDTSGGDCWNGDTANAGDDDKGGRFSGSAGVGPVWVANGGTLLVWPRANALGGTYETNKQAFTHLMRENGSAQVKYNILADDDSIWAAADSAQNSNYDLFYFGPYTPRTGLTPDTNTGYVMLQRCYISSDLDWNAYIGTTLGTNSVREGGIAWSATDNVRALHYSSISGVTGQLYQPNPLVGEFDLMDIFLRVDDSGGSVNSYGLVGKLDTANLAFVYNAPCVSPNSALTKVAFGPPTLSYGKWLLPWDGATLPGSGSTQTGVQFP